MRIILSFILYFIITTYLLAGTIRQDKSDANYLEYGQKYISVVKISGYMNIVHNSTMSVFETIEKVETIASGSAVVIDPHWILTAAHVVTDSNNHFFYIGSKKYTVDDIIVHPSYDKNRKITKKFSTMKNLFM